MKSVHQIKFVLSATGLLLSALSIAMPQQAGSAQASAKSSVPAHSHPRDAKGMTISDKPAAKNEKSDAAVDESKKKSESKLPAHNHMRDAKGIYVAPKTPAKPDAKPASKSEKAQASEAASAK